MIYKTYSKKIKSLPLKSRYQQENLILKTR